VLGASLSPDTALILGGRSAHGYQVGIDRIGAKRLTDMESFRRLLRQLGHLSGTDAEAGLSPSERPF